jgi:hypothetical protein
MHSQLQVILDEFGAAQESLQALAGARALWRTASKRFRRDSPGSLR